MAPTLTYEKTVVNELFFALAEGKMGSSSRFKFAKNSRTIAVLERGLNVTDSFKTSLIHKRI
jgi:hypothetical protein